MKVGVDGEGRMPSLRSWRFSSEATPRSAIEPMGKFGHRLPAQPLPIAVAWGAVSESPGPGVFTDVPAFFVKWIFAAATGFARPSR